MTENNEKLRDIARKVGHAKEFNSSHISLRIEELDYLIDTIKRLQIESDNRGEAVKELFTQKEQHISTIKRLTEEIESLNKRYLEEFEKKHD